MDTHWRCMMIETLQQAWRLERDAAGETPQHCWTNTPLLLTDWTDWWRKGNPADDPTCKHTKITLLLILSHTYTKHTKAKSNYYLPVAQGTEEDVSQNPSCHEADVLHRDFPVVTAYQVPLRRKRKTKWRQLLSVSDV